LLSKDEIESNIADLDKGWELKDGKIVNLHIVCDEPKSSKD
jgi:hypothetical protein